MAPPAVTVVMPVRQEEAHVARAIDSLASQIEACDGELVVAEGDSTDRTRAVLHEVSKRVGFLRLVENPEGHPATGLNRAISVARSNVIVRADAHTEYATDYIESCLRILSERAGPAVVGGPLVPRGSTEFGRAVASVMTSPLGVGPGAFHHARRAGPADTVYLGAFPASLARALGGYRAFPSRAGEDADFCARARRAGYEVWLDPAIRSTYRPRESASALALQSWRYGLAKAEILMVSRLLPSWRPLAPAALMAVLARAALVPNGRGSRSMVAVWLGSLAFASRSAGPWPQRARFVAAAAVMQTAYGAGSWSGLLRGRTAARPFVGPDAGWGEVGDGSVR